jgi:hypothetical protein
MYHVMIILTDGDYHDKLETMDLIIELSKFPVSLIIIGVGHDDADFSGMEQLDGDKNPLRGSNG